MSRFGRIGISAITPVIEDGAYSAKACVREEFPITATIFREGHDALGAQVVFTSPNATTLTYSMFQIEPAGLDLWQVWVRLEDLGDWQFRVEAYSDRWATWCHNAQIKLPIGQDVELVALELEELLAEAATVDPEALGDIGVFAPLVQVPAQARTQPTPTHVLLAVSSSTQAADFMRACLPKQLLTSSDSYPMRVHRKLAQAAAWYEFFPRSVGAKYSARWKRWKSGTFDDCLPLLERIAQLGFDVAYLPPIHPIGHTMKKGPNNTLDAGPFDPGSPWAIGDETGGHMAVHAALGGIKAFDRFVTRAHDLGLEVALDFALQASPDHPWLTTNPEWFTTRSDGTIAYAENPPKKYQDIYPINFDNDRAGITDECERILEFWISHGVTIFRVDNPHTKPIDFWADLLERIHSRHPEVIFLAEAFTRPAMMQALAKVGFHESYTYFTWRNTRDELAEYLNEVAHDTAFQMRPNFFTNTPDINPEFTQNGEAVAFAIRIVLAATMSPAWGMYSGFELLEHAPLRAGGEEYLDSEKYQYRPRDFDATPNLNELVALVNRIRHAHPALQQLHRTLVLETTNDHVFAFAKGDGDDQIIVVVNLDPHATSESDVGVDLGWLGVHSDTVQVHDELTGQTFTWGARNFVRLTPAQPAHILSVTHLRDARTSS
ncbi:MAG: alpha-1,4-glucan--maltose-1-phosphate maltosyltransferase [Propionibacteriaceae bacterium]|nr:alpha-1,4-glucan--maltose-1-phosphate maltosyltransferase [Propionibacteriaceae bacterium]